MKIGIYVDVARDERPTGIGLHVRSLLNALAALDRDNEYLLYYPARLFGRDGGFPHCPPQDNFHPRPVRLPAGWQGTHPTLWWDWILPHALRADRVDVFHGPNHYLPAFDRRRSIVTIHDLAHFRMEVHSPGVNAMAREWTQKVLGRAGAAIALSENTRRDLEEFGVEPECIRVIYGGGYVVPEERIRYDRLEELQRSLRLPERYILFVGTLQPRKNVPFLIRSFAALKKRTGLPHRLVLAGSRDVAAAEIDGLIRELGLGEDVLITGYVEDWQLPLLYKKADLFVLPTLYEGFTLVTLEAMAYGVPVIATDTSSLREGVGDAAVLVPVNDVDALRAAMELVLTDEKLRGKLTQRGKRQAQRFTWEQCARQTLELYREVVQVPGGRN